MKPGPCQFSKITKLFVLLYIFLTLNFCLNLVGHFFSSEILTFTLMYYLLLLLLFIEHIAQLSFLTGFRERGMEGWRERERRRE